MEPVIARVGGDYVDLVCRRGVDGVFVRECRTASVVFGDSGLYSKLALIHCDDVVVELLWLNSKKWQRTRDASARHFEGCGTSGCFSLHFMQMTPMMLACKLEVVLPAKQKKLDSGKSAWYLVQECF